MSRKYKLSWQPGSAGRKGRWRKKYKGHSYYFSGGRGKTDRAAYDAALLAWEKKRLSLDAAAPKPHQEDYERSIAEWELVLSWSRKHGEEEMADTAMAKLERLRKLLAAVKPKPINLEDTFDGQFDRAVRYPGLDEAITQLGNIIEESASSAHELFAHMPGYAEYVTNASRLMEEHLGAPAGDKPNTYIVPTHDMNGSDSLDVERKIWQDRLDVMQRSAPAPEMTVKGQVEIFLAGKKADAAVGSLTHGRVSKLQSQLSHFQDWIGHETSVEEIDSSKLIGYRTEILKEVESSTWTLTTANERMSTVKSFVRWLWQTEVIPALPRVLDNKSQALDVGKSSSTIVVFTKPEIKSLLQKASDRTKLYILLMLNCGMTQKDIADIQFSEVDWKAGRITRKRSKTRRHDNVPEVSYLLWPETLKLLQREQNQAGEGRILLNKNGWPLWYEELAEDGKYKKNDNVRSAFDRLRRKLKINKPLISLKKTSASLIRGRKDSSGLEDLFLGHAPQKLSDRHYAKPPRDLLDEALTWLREEYCIEKCGVV